MPKRGIFAIVMKGGTISPGDTGYFYIHVHRYWLGSGAAYGDAYFTFIITVTSGIPGFEFPIVIYSFLYILGLFLLYRKILSSPK